jgi:hypothetical protein
MRKKINYRRPDPFAINPEKVLARGTKDNASDKIATFLRRPKNVALNEEFGAHMRRMYAILYFREHRHEAALIAAFLDRPENAALKVVHESMMAQMRKMWDAVQKICG